MPYIPHTCADVESMLKTIGAASIHDLFDEIPSYLHIDGLHDIPDGLSELALTQLAEQRAKLDARSLNFIGAGAYEHHIPAAVWDITSRGEFLTAYTPYQAEASQGTLQLLYEFQTMMANLMGMNVSNTSLYDGASALAEAILMAVRSQRKVKTKRILVAGTLNPNYHRVAHTIVKTQGIELVSIPFDATTGCLDHAVLQTLIKEPFTAMVIVQPNFFGCLEEVDMLTTMAHEHNALAIALVNPMAMVLLKEPGQWGKTGADIACGELQPFGIPLASGGPYAGFLCCKQMFVRQMPGRIIGQTQDAQGRTGYTLTLQAREQHIRRGKATSNICTNQGLLVTAATIYMSLMGADGLRRIAMACHTNARQLVTQLTDLLGVELAFPDQAYFHEVTLRLARPVDDILKKLSASNIQGGFNLSTEFSTLQDCLLVCATETKTPEQFVYYSEQLQRALEAA